MKKRKSGRKKALAGDSRRRSKSLAKEPSREEVVLAMKEQMRQVQHMIASIGSEAVDEHLQSQESQEVFAKATELLAGKITVEEFEAATQHVFEELAAIVRKTDDPVGVTTLDVENEAAAKNLAPAAQLLAVDATRRAGDGISKEDWILEVLKGHAADEDAQLGCMRLIVTLWSEGPWPWPRSS